MNLRAADPEGQPWVERGGPGVLVRMAAVGAKASSSRTQAMVGLPPLSAARFGPTATAGDAAPQPTFDLRRSLFRSPAAALR